MKFEKHIAKICRKVSQQVAVFKRLRKLLPFETREDLYQAFMHLFVRSFVALLWQGINRKVRESQRAGPTFCQDKHSFYDVLLKMMGQITLLNETP